MQFTTSPGYEEYEGRRMHDDTVAIPTSVSGDDMNMIIWSLMEVVTAGGQTPVAFDKTDPATYQALLNAILSMAQGPRGRPFIHLGDTPPLRAMELNGATLNRGTYANLWEDINNPNNGFTLVDDATYLAGQSGLYSTGDGVNTFRLPDFRAEALRGWDNGRGVDIDRLIGSLQLDAIQNLTGDINNTLVSFNNGLSNSLFHGAFKATDIVSTSSSEGMTGSGQDFSFNLSFDASRVARTAEETRVRGLSVMFCVRY